MSLLLSLLPSTELFYSYRAQLDSSFAIYKQNNLAITKQENELRSIKIETELMFKSYEVQKRELEITLENLKKEIEFKKTALKDVNFQSKEARRRFRYCIKKQIKYAKTTVGTKETQKTNLHLRLLMDYAYPSNKCAAVNTLQRHMLVGTLSKDN